MSAGACLGILQGLIQQGFKFSWEIPNLLSLLMMAGGIGLLLLKDWGRWVLLIGCVAFLILLTGPSLIRFQIGPVVLRNLIFYGLFIALLAIPPARAATR